MSSHDPSGGRPLVLIVDDDVAVSTALGRQLKSLGYDILVAADGDAGFEEALRAQPAVVFTDVHMPGMNGHALLRRLMDAGLQTSVILMSGRGELDDAIGALREGAVDYLKKPWSKDDLVAVLGRAIALFEAYRELSLPPVPARPTARRHDPDHNASRDASPEALVDAFALVEELVGQVTVETLTLPTVPSSVALLRDLTGGPDQSLGEVTRLIETDPVLREPILRLASQTPDLERHCRDIRAVVAAMGRDAVQAVVETVVLREAFPIRVGPLRILNDRIWRFSVARALAMRGIADVAEPKTPIDRNQCYLGGLLLDVGASYLLFAIANEMERRGGGIADSAKMTAAVDAHHARIGALVLQRWGMSSALASLVRDHHADSPQSASSLWCAAALGGAVAVRLAGFGDPTGTRELKPESLARCAYTLEVGDTSLRGLTRSLTENVSRVWAACG